jgi:hypothetical protein
MHHPLATSLLYIAAVFREINPFLNNWPVFTRPQVALTRFYAKRLVQQHPG